MEPDRIHHAKSADGTEIAGHVEGHGPPLVLVHGSLEDGDLCWESMLPHLSRHFTCYLPSTRSRGLSGASDDLAPERRVEDVVSFVASIGEPVNLFGESDGGTLALGAAARSDAIAAVAVYEPVVLEVADEDLQTALEGTLGRVGQAVSDDRLADAAQSFSELVANDDELAALTDSGYLDEAGRYAPLLLRELDEEAQSSAPSATDPSVLADVTVPILLMHGQRSVLRDWFTAGVQHIAEHVPNHETREIVGAGHFGVALEPAAIAREVTRFLQEAGRPS